MLRDTQVSFVELTTVARHISDVRFIELGRFSLNSNLALLPRVYLVELAFVMLKTGNFRLLAKSKLPLLMG